MDNIQKTDESGSIIWDGHTSPVMDKFVHSTGAQSGLYHFNDGLAGIDVWNYLATAFRLFCAFFHYYDLWCL